jgi:hypothetical protein
VEKDNDVPIMDRRASGHEKRSQCKQSHTPHGSSRSEKKVPETLRGFVSEKMKENEPRPPVFETGSIDFKKT